MVIMERWERAFVETEYGLDHPVYGSAPHSVGGPVIGMHSNVAIPVPADSLVLLDRPSWWRLLIDHGFTQMEIDRFDDLVAHWLRQEDYLRLLSLARDVSPTQAQDAADELFDLWIDEACGARLIELIDSMGYRPRTYPGCYAIASALRAVRAALDHVWRINALNDVEVEALESHLTRDDSGDGSALPDGW